LDTRRVEHRADASGHRTADEGRHGERNLLAEGDTTFLRHDRVIGKTRQSAEVMDWLAVVRQARGPIHHRARCSPSRKRERPVRLHSSRQAMRGFAIAALILATEPLWGHHSFAKYDATKSITITGTVTKVEWLNPHIYVYVDVKDSTGKDVNYAVEGGAPNGLFRQGWRKDTLKIGDTISIEGSMAKDGSNTVRVLNVSTGEWLDIWVYKFGPYQEGSTRVVLGVIPKSGQSYTFEGECSRLVYPCLYFSEGLETGSLTMVYYSGIIEIRTEYPWKVED